MQPKISVIVPIYNTEKYLSQCLDSLLNQTLKDIEIICVNDGSTDNSEKIVQEYTKKDKRVRYIFQKNQGRSVARNTGLDAVKSSYLMFCDSDDWYDATMCEKMYDAITKNDVDFVCCGIKMEYDIPNPTSKKSDESYYRIKYTGVVSVHDEMIDRIDGSSCNKIMKKEVLDKYNIRYPQGLDYEDFCLFFQLLSVSKKIYFLPAYLYHYRRHSDSIMVSTFAGSIKAIDHLKIMEVIYHFLMEHNLFEKWEKCFYSTYLKYFHAAHHHLPIKNKHLAFDVAIPFMKKMNSDRNNILPINEQMTWNSILNKTYSEYVKVIKIGKMKIIKISQEHSKYKVQFLGITLFQRKIKKNKKIYFVLYIPIFKIKLKSDKSSK